MPKKGKVGGRGKKRKPAVSEEEESVEETEACLDDGEEQFENFNVESPVEQRVSEEKKDDEGETLSSDDVRSRVRCCSLDCLLASVDNLRPCTFS